MSDIPYSDAVVAHPMLQAYWSGEIPRQNHFDTTVLPLIPDGANTGSADAQSLREDQVKALELFAKYPHHLLAKLAVRHAHTRLRDSRYSRLGRCSLAAAAEVQNANLVDRQLRRLTRHLSGGIAGQILNNGDRTFMGDFV